MLKDISILAFIRYTNALLLSLLPVIMAYKTPGLPIGLSTFLIVVCFFNTIVYMLFEQSFAHLKIAAPILFYLVYIFSLNTGSNRFLPIIIIFYIFAFSSGAANSSYLRSFVEKISCLASFCLLVQVMVHALGNVHIPMIDCSLILDSLSVYNQSIATGYSEIEQIYRPSAFFLEPAHFTQYCIVGLGSSLYRNEKKIAFFISLGILFTTSGFGFVLVFAMWTWWYISNNKVSSLVEILKKIMLLIIFIPPLLVFLSTTSFFGKVISRFLPTDSSDGYNAIDGRLFWWNMYFGKLSWSDLIVGLGADKLPDHYFTGFMTVLYAYGIVGTVLFLLSYILLALNGKGLTRVLSIIYIGLFFLANLTNLISLIFSFGTILTLYFYENKVDCSIEVKYAQTAFELKKCTK